MRIPQEAFERIVQQAVVRPAGRQFRGEPARQVEILRFLNESERPAAYDVIHSHLRRRGVLRGRRDDDTARRKAIAQAVEAVNIKLGTFFFLARDPRLLEEMFRIQVHLDESARPAYSLQDFFEMRKISGVSFYHTTEEPAGGITREIFELVTEIRPRRLDMMAPSFNSFFGNPEFRGMLTGNLAHEDARVRVLLLDPDGSAAASLEIQERTESPLLGSLRDRIRATLSRAAELTAVLAPAQRERFEVRLVREAPLWRFRMIFLPDVLHLRLSVPGRASQTLIKLSAASSLYSSLHDVFEQQWSSSTRS
ncbi:MAG TPA: hypothetical protein VFG76_13940 [Candidatus Polarisedimenticolia bacterium]|nr:hypothetical protein [Candidatus Polarisedimenticolia bacterium]